jgi:molecular chaperone GrpE (heat shock protein)
MRNQLKEEKDQYAQLDLKYTNYKKEIERNKEVLFDLIQKSLFTLPLGTT